MGKFCVSDDWYGLIDMVQSGQKFRSLHEISMTFQLQSIGGRQTSVYFTINWSGEVNVNKSRNGLSCKGRLWEANTIL